MEKFAKTLRQSTRPLVRGNELKSIRVKVRCVYFNDSKRTDFNDLEVQDMLGVKPKLQFSIKSTKDNRKWRWNRSADECDQR